MRLPSIPILSDIARLTLKRGSNYCLICLSFFQRLTYNAPKASISIRTKKRNRCTLGDSTKATRAKITRFEECSNNYPKLKAETDL